MQWRDLIAASRLLASMSDSDTVPRPDSLRRAVSTAYYAVFHALANSNADCLIGPPTDPLLEHAWHRVRRGLDHNQARRNLEQDLHRFSSPVQEFVTTFAGLQDARHAADYDARRQFTVTETFSWIDLAEEAITDFLGVALNEQRAVAAQALIRRRTN